MPLWILVVCGFKHSRDRGGKAPGGQREHLETGNLGLLGSGGVWDHPASTGRTTQHPSGATGARTGGNSVSTEGGKG